MCLVCEERDARLPAALESHFMNSPLQINIIANSSAGYWKRHPGALEQLRLLRGSGTKIFVTHSPEELRRLFSDQLLAPPSSSRRIDVIAGGDGTISQFLSCRRNYGPDTTPLLLLPAGTNNAIANDLGLRRPDVNNMIRALQSGCAWRSKSRVSIDVTIGGRLYSGFVFETGFVSHVLNEFYEHPNYRTVALAFILKTIFDLLRGNVINMSISKGKTDLRVQSLFVTGITRMIFGLRPFGRSPQLPTVAQFQLTSSQQRWGWWRLITGRVGKLLNQRSLILQPLADNERLSIVTREPANLDGEMILNRDNGTSETVDISRGSTIEFICEVKPR
jgi:diacylglycerol kinase family enzyme